MLLSVFSLSTKNCEKHELLFDIYWFITNFLHVVKVFRNFFVKCQMYCKTNYFKIEKDLKPHFAVTCFSVQWFNDLNYSTKSNNMAKWQYLEPGSKVQIHCLVFFMLTLHSFVFCAMLIKVESATMVQRRCPEVCENNSRFFSAVILCTNLSKKFSGNSYKVYF